MKETNRNVLSGVCGRIKIEAIMFAWMIITFFIIVFLIITARDYSKADSIQGKLTEKVLVCHEYIDQLQKDSDTLKNSIWMFVVSEDTKYAKSFLNETKLTESIDETIKLLKQQNITSQEEEEIENIQVLSNNIVNQELYYVRLFYQAIGTDIPKTLTPVELTNEDMQLNSEEMKNKVSSFVFGKDYLQNKEELVNKLSSFGENLSSRLESEIKKASLVITNAAKMHNIALWALMGWAVIFWVLFRHFLVLPMKKALEELNDKSRDKPLVLRGPYELHRLIDSFNKSVKWLTDKDRELYEIKMRDPVTTGLTSIPFDLTVQGYLEDDYSFAFVTMDIKRFTIINELYGEETGNQVLREMYQIICEELRSGEIAIRSRADIFNIILLETSEEVIKKRITRIKNAIKDAFQNENWNDYRIILNCGVYMTRKGDRDVTTIRGRANVARKKYKRSQTMISTCYFFSDDEAKNLFNEQFIENQMDKALENEEFKVFLQPKVGLENENIIGAEALVRWEMENGKLVPPNEFIPLFEKDGFIVQLDYYMFRHVCALLRKWLDEGKEVVPVSVNLSRCHFNEDVCIEGFRAIQAEYQIPADLVEFEITEEIIMENWEKFKELIEKIHDSKYSCSIDDFGSGYSSLNVLKELSFDVLKIDRIFFDETDNERGKLIIKAVIKMAQSLGMRTVAEGVETRELVDYLKQVGCDMVQGYVFYRPMSANEFEKLL